MAKEDRICSVKGIQDNSKDVTTLRGPSDEKNLYESNLSKPYYRKSTTNLYTQKEHPLFNDEILIKKSFSFSGTPHESESQKQLLQVPNESDRSNHRREPELDMKTVSLLKRAQLSGEKKRQSAPVTSNISRNESRQRNTIDLADLTLSGTDLESQNLITLNNLSSSNILLSDSSTNSGLRKKNSMIPRRKIRNTITLNREPISKTSTNPKQSKSKVRVLRKVVLKKPSNPDQATKSSKISSESKLPTSNSRILQKIPSKYSTSVDQSSRSSIDVASTKNKSRTVRKIPSKNITNAEPASKMSVELAKSRTIQFKSRNDQESEKPAINKLSQSRASRPSVKKSTNIESNESEKQNLLKTFPIRVRSRSKSINTSTRRHSEANIPIVLANDESPTQVRGNNDPSTEPANVQQFDQTDSSTIPNSDEPTTTNTSQTTSIPDEQERTVAQANENQANQPTNDHVEKAPSEMSNHEDEHFTSPSERIPNPDGDIRQSSPETRTQPIPIDPNTAYAAKHDLETWLRNSAAQSDTSRPMKTTRVHPYPKFPVIRPCDRDLTCDPEDCKKKLEQKLERMHKLKQAYYSDPQDNIPFINLAYTKEGIFVDEPIENAFVYDDDFLKNENSENYSRLSSRTRGNPSESVVFSSTRLKQRHEEASASLASHEVVNNRSSYSKWMDKILDDTEINMVENVLHEFQEKFNRLAINIQHQQASSTSEASSISGPITRSKQRVVIPKRSSCSDQLY